MSEMVFSNELPRTGPRLTPTESERTLAAILDAALDFLWSKPCRDFSLRGLMAPLDVGRSAFYQYFRDLNELMGTLRAVTDATVADRRLEQVWTDFLGRFDLECWYSLQAGPNRMILLR